MAMRMEDVRSAKSANAIYDCIRFNTELSRPTKMCIEALVSLRNRGVRAPTNKQIAGRLGCSLRTAQRSMAMLVCSGIIERRDIGAGDGQKSGEIKFLISVGPNIEGVEPWR